MTILKGVVGVCSWWSHLVQCVDGHVIHGVCACPPRTHTPSVTQARGSLASTWATLHTHAHTHTRRPALFSWNGRQAVSVALKNNGDADEYKNIII